MQRRIEGGGTITVPVPLHREIRRGTLLSIVRQSGLPRSVFEPTVRRRLPGTAWDVRRPTVLPPATAAHASSR